jgi:hypothetical protein
MIEMKEQPLFEKEDQIYSAIASEEAIVIAEMKEVDKAIERKKNERLVLQGRYEMLSVAKKLAEPKEKGKKKKTK